MTRLLSFLLLSSLGLGSGGFLRTSRVQPFSDLVAESEDQASASLSLSSYYDSYQTSSYYNGALSIENPSDLASLQLEFYFDKDYIVMDGVYNQIEESLFDYKAEVDHVSLTYIFSTPLEQSACLFSYSYHTLDQTGKTVFDVAVIDANSSTGSAEVAGVRQAITIAKAPTEKKYCYFESNTSSSSGLKQNDTFQIAYSSYYLSDIAAADFVVTYDRDELELVSFLEGGFLQDSSVISDHKENKDGTITLSYVASQSVPNYEFFTLEFKVKKNVTGSTDIAFKSISLCDFSFLDFQNVSLTNTVQSVYDETLVAKKRMFLTSTKSTDNKTLDVAVNLEEGSNLAAGDFQLYFPVDHFAFTGYQDTRDKSIVENLIVNVTQAKAGRIDFHIFNIKNNIVSETSFLVFRFSLADVCHDFATQVSLSGQEMCDLSSNPLELDFPSLTVQYEGLSHSFGDWVVDLEATCKVDGKKHRVCCNCGFTEEAVIEKHPDGCDDCLVKEFIETYIKNQKEEPYEGLSPEERNSSCRSKYSSAKEALEKLPESARNLFLNDPSYVEEANIYRYWADSFNQRSAGFILPSPGASQIGWMSLLSLTMFAMALALVLLSKKRSAKE